jgi:hypothetical protein
MLSGGALSGFVGVLALQILIVAATVGYAAVTGAPLALWPGDGMGGAILAMCVGVIAVAGVGALLSSLFARRRAVV